MYSVRRNYILKLSNILRKGSPNLKEYKINCFVSTDASSSGDSSTGGGASHTGGDSGPDGGSNSRGSPPQEGIQLLILLVML